MNQKTRLSMIARNRGLFKLGSARNVVKFNVGNTYEHEKMKFDFCFYLTATGHEWLCEAEFKGGRADVVDLCCSGIYEILVSEQPENLVEKSKVYPLPIIGINCVVINTLDVKSSVIGSVLDSRMKK